MATPLVKKEYGLVSREKKKKTSLKLLASHSMLLLKKAPRGTIYGLTTREIKMAG